MMGTHPSPLLVHFLPVARRRRLHPAAGVTVRRVETGGELLVARHLPLDVHVAAVRSVQGDGIALGGLIISFHDVDLAVGRPVGRVRQPQCRPRAAAVRRVDDVEDEETLVVAGFGLQAHRLATLSRGRVGRVDFQHDGGVRRVGEVECLRGLLVDVSDCVSRILLPSN